MRYLVLNPPYIMKEGQVIPPAAAMLPMGPLGIATELVERGHELDYLDFAFAESLPDEIDASEYDGVLIAIHTLRNVPTAKELLNRVKGASYVVAGGNVCSELGKEDLGGVGVFADAVFRGYAHGHLDRIESATQGDIKAGSASSRMPAPNLSLLTAELRDVYWERSSARYPIIGPGGFGCAWSCNYCTAKMLSRRVERDFSVIEREIDQAKRLGYRELWCVDNISLVDADLALEFDQMVERAGLTWLGMTRAETVIVARNRLPKFRRLTDIALGVEAPARQLVTLNRGERRDNDERLHHAFGLLHDSGITSTAFVMLDLPGSLDADYWALVDLLAYVRPGNVSWSFFNPPAVKAITLGLDLAATGFYRWPLGFARIPDTRVVQFAMVITGTWWMNWAPESFVRTPDHFGVVFDEGEIVQTPDARSVVGDLWSAWDFNAAPLRLPDPPHLAKPLLERTGA
ncbi:MAG TPA: radical SAM protein [Longimicrobium sp.]|jgi:hypothetical protein